MVFKWLHSRMVSKHREEGKETEGKGRKRKKELRKGKEKQGKKPLTVTHRTHTEI